MDEKKILCIRSGLRRACTELSSRGLYLSSKWTAEQLFGMIPEQDQAESRKGLLSSEWDSDGEYFKTCSNAFVFSLRRVHQQGGGMLRRKVEEEDYAIYNDSSYGPTFGGGHDIFISSDCNENTKSYVHEESYRLPADCCSYYMVCGDGSDQMFRVSEIEVMQCS